MKNTQFTVIAELTALEGHEAEILDLIKNQVTESRKEKDVVFYSSNEVINEKGKYVFIEIYKSEEAFEANKTSAHTQAFFKAVNGKLKGKGVTAIFMKPVDIAP